MTVSAVEPERAHWVDLRLAGPAVCAWLATLAALVTLRAAGVLAAVAGVVLLGCVVLRRGRAWRGVAVCAVCLLAALAGTGLRIHQVAVSPVAVLADDGAAVTADVVVMSDPRLLPGRVSGSRLGEDRVLLRVRVQRLTSVLGDQHTRAPALLVGTGTAWSSLLPSQHLTVRAVLAPVDDPLVAAFLRARGDPVRVGPPSPVQRVAGRLRHGLRDAAGVLPADEAGLLPGLVDGDTSRQTPAVHDNFQAVGLTHLTAVSGSNVAVVIAAALLLARLAGLGRRGRAVMGLAAVVGFAVLARPDPSVLRASVMGAIAVVAVVSGRERSALPTLSAAVLVLVLAAPELAPSPGFALSVLATAGLLVVAPPLRDLLARRLPVAVAEAIAVPTAAQLVCAPVIAAISGSVSLAAVPANLLAAPAVAPATVLGVSTALVAPVSSGLAQALAWAAGWPCRWLVVVAARMTAIPDGAFGWPSGVRGGLLLTAATVGLLIAARLRWARWLLAAVAAGVAPVLVALAVLGPVGPARGWRIAACDVGQGDGLVLSAGSGQGVVVDTGPDPAGMASCLHRLGITSVPVLVLTHLHADHVEGLPGVLAAVPVGQVQLNPLREPPQEWQRVRRWLADAHIPTLQPPVGATYTVGRVTWRVLGPVRPYVGTNSDPNNSSLVLRAVIDGLSVLMTGDVEPPAQRDLLSTAGPYLSADVLKVPHHGSDHSEDAFLAAPQARIGLISVGAGNTYGHPSARTISRLAADGTPTLRTDTQGMLTVGGTRATLTVSTDRPGLTPAQTAAPATAALAEPSVTGRGAPPALSRAILDGRPDGSGDPAHRDARQRAPPVTGSTGEPTGAPRRGADPR